MCGAIQPPPTLGILYWVNVQVLPLELRLHVDIAVEEEDIFGFENDLSSLKATVFHFCNSTKGRTSLSILCYKNTLYNIQNVIKYKALQ